MVFLPSQTFSVDLAMVDAPADRARFIVAHIATARPFLGGQDPTHVVLDHSMLVDIEVLEGAGLVVVRRPLAWPGANCALLGVPGPENTGEVGPAPVSA